MNPELTRRQVLLGGIAVVVAACSGGGSGTSGSSGASPRTSSDATSNADGVASATTSPVDPPADLALMAGPGIESLFADPAALGAVGTAVRSTPGTPDAAGVEEVLVPLGAAVDAAGVVDTADPIEFAAAVRDQVRRDHDAGDTLVVQGWVLARTQAALASLFG